VDCSQYHWTTVNELKFIDRIGTQFSKEHGPSKYTKRQLLQKYISGMSKRVNWGGINRKEVLFYATEMLNTL
jgi:hypothetical protein